MKTMTLMVLFGILIAIPAGAEPFCRTRPTYAHAQIVAHTGPTHDIDGHIIRHRDRVRVDVIEVAQINPAYVSSYSPDGYDSATQADLLSELRRLRAQVDALSKSQTTAAAQAATAAAIAAALAAKGKPGDSVIVPPIILPPPGTPAIVPPVPGPADKPKITDGAATLAIITAHCAACHQTGNLAPDQRFTLLDVRGNLVSLTDKQKLRVITKTYSGQMPPPNNAKGMAPLSDPEVAAIVDLLSAQ